MSRKTFLNSVTVLDTETTNLKPELAEIVEIAGAAYDGQNWQVTDMLLGARDGIPPEASAKTHISNRMIAGLPTFAAVQNQVIKIMRWDTTKYWVAHNCGYDQTVLAKAWCDAGDSSGRSERVSNKDNWICTYRLSKRLLDLDFADMQYNLSYLRYKLDLPVDDNFESHRAGADTVVCAVLFEFLLDYALATDRVTDGADLGDQIHALCWQTIPYKTWPFGKNKGKKFAEIPTDYYLWALTNLDAINEAKPDYNRDLCESVRSELESRLENN